MEAVGNPCRIDYPLPMPARNVNPTEHLGSVVETDVTLGRFSNASEVVREGLRLLEQREAEDAARLAWLQSAAVDAFSELDRGESTEFASMNELEAFIHQIAEEPRTQTPRL